MSVNNRSIEFRCWNETKQTMYYEDFILHRNKVYFPKLVGDLYNLGVGYDLPVMQYIGLKSIDGVKLYESDLVKINTKNFHDIENYLIFEIIYREPGFSLKCLNSGKVFGLFSTLLASRLEIIGNIYSDPEFLSSSIFSF